MAAHNLSTSGCAFLRLSGIPVLVYHGLTAGPQSFYEGLSWRERKFWTTGEQFEEQLQAIRRRGVDMRRLTEAIDSNHAANSNRSVVLTFDDGYVSDYEIAFPKLLEGGGRAEFFVNPDTIGQPGYLSWAQAREMHARGMSFQSHAQSHCYLTHQPPDEVRRQLASSKQTIEDQLGSRVDYLAVPYGDFNSGVLRIARETGYRAVCTGRSWPARLGRYTIDRTAVYGYTGTREFERLLARNPLSYGRRAARATALALPKQAWLQFRRLRPAGSKPKAA